MIEITIDHLIKRLEFAKQNPVYIPIDWAVLKLGKPRSWIEYKVKTGQLDWARQEYSGLIMVNKIQIEIFKEILTSNYKSEEIVCYSGHGPKPNKGMVIKKIFKLIKKRMEKPEEADKVIKKRRRMVRIAS
jgi:hypothetical protein